MPEVVFISRMNSAEKETPNAEAEPLFIWSTNPPYKPSEFNSNSPEVEKFIPISMASPSSSKESPSESFSISKKKSVNVNRLFTGLNPGMVRFGTEAQR